MIEINNAKTAYSYGDGFVISSLVFREGRITSVIGRNGSGKTTMLRCMAGILPYEGSIRIDGKECRDYADRERAGRVGFLPQMVKAVNLDVETLVCHGRYPHLGNYRRMSEKDKEVVMHALAITKMTAFRKRNLKELSGGELKRAYLAMVIAQDAPMILLDEPTTYMDVESQTLYYDVIGHLAKNGHGIVQTCHNVEQSFTYSDQIVLMSDRTVKAWGTSEEIAGREQDFRKAFGAYIKKMDDADLLYPYVMIK